MAMEPINKVVDQIYFGLLSPQEIRRLSVAEIQTADTLIYQLSFQTRTPRYAAFFVMLPDASFIASISH